MILIFCLLKLSHFISDLQNICLLQWGKIDPAGNVRKVNIENARCARQEQFALIGFQNSLKRDSF